MRKGKLGRYLFMVFWILFTLALPFIIALVFGTAIMDALPRAEILNPKLFDADGSVRTEALKELPGFQDHTRVQTEFPDHVLFTAGQDVFRIVKLPPGVGDSELVALFDADVRSMKVSNKGVEVSGQSVVKGIASRMTTRFSDGTKAYTTLHDGYLLQMTGPSPDPGQRLREVELLIPTPGLSDSQRFVAENFIVLFILIMAVYGLWWILEIFRIGKWAARVVPEPGVEPVPADELKQRLMSVNDLDVPFQVTEVGPNKLRAEWRLDKKWKGLMAAQSMKKVSIITMRIRPKRGEVTLVESQRSVNYSRGLLSAAASFSFFRGLSFASYEKGAVYGLDFENGRFKITGYNYDFNINEMKQPLLNAVVESGYRWSPRIFFV